MTTQLDRPERPPRSKPVPAADAGVDPIDYRPTATPEPSHTGNPTTVAAPARKTPDKTRQSGIVGGRPQATVQLGVSVSPEVAELIEAEKRKTGRHKRDIVEQAIIDALA